MWIYEKRLQYPVKITKTCPKTAQLIISQYGGPDGSFLLPCVIWPSAIPCPSSGSAAC